LNSINQLKNRIRKGIPNELRGRAWRSLIPIQYYLSSHKGEYQKYLNEKTNPKISKQIDLDINRTFRLHKLYQEKYGKGQIKLWNVLNAYSNYNKNLGYTQGMNTIAALLLMYLDEEVFLSLILEFLLVLGAYYGAPKISNGRYFP
jgi:hypothetical protein